MRVAVPKWSGRVSPVLDVAGHLLLVEAEHGRELGRRDVPVEATDLLARARRIAESHPDVLICGAVSRPLEALLSSAGIRLISHKCGPVEDVLQAFLEGHLTERSFLMPGCCGRRRQFRGGRRCGRNRAQAKGQET